jgi:hypothetical protein
MTTNLERGKLQGMGVRRLVRINRVEEGGSQMRIGGIMPMRIYCRPVVALVRTRTHGPVINRRSGQMAQSRCHDVAFFDSPMRSREQGRNVSHW